MFVRALFVLGAAAAGTVAGWLLCSGSASAATLPSVGDVIGTVTSVGLPASPAAPPVAVLPSVHGVAGELGDAVRRLGAHQNARQPATPAPIALPPVPASASALADRSGDRTVATVSHRPAATARSHRTAMASRAVRSPAHAGPSRLPAPRATPVAPGHSVPLPAVPASSGGAGAVGSGGIGAADTTGAPPIPALDAQRVVPMTAPLGRGAATRQPGTTPD